MQHLERPVQVWYLGGSRSVQGPAAAEHKRSAGHQSEDGTDLPSASDPFAGPRFKQRLSIPKREFVDDAVHKRMPANVGIGSIVDAWATDVDVNSALSAPVGPEPKT